MGERQAAEQLRQTKRCIEFLCPTSTSNQKVCSDFLRPNRDFDPSRDGPQFGAFEVMIACIPAPPSLQRHAGREAP